MMPPAMQRMREGDYSHPVIADLNWTLRRYPNHIIALRALIDYVIGGGHFYEFLAPQCYFVRARQFAPDHVDVFMLEGLFYWKTGDLRRAVKLYERATAMDSTSAEAHYHLGLLYFSLAEYDASRSHANAAYAAGYPLPGLRKKLEAAGHWKDR